MKKLLLLCVMSSGAVYGMNGNAATSSTDCKDDKAIAAPAGDMDKQLFEANIATARETKKLADLSERRLEIEELSLALQVLKLTEEDISGQYANNKDAITTLVRCKKCGEPRVTAFLLEDYSSSRKTHYRSCGACNHKNPVSVLEDVKKSAAILIINHKFRDADKK